ncbi:MAG: chemotaxis protein CheW [Terriglobales bacterium]|jgi:purine-binding chemotaxis protein CheW
MAQNEQFCTFFLEGHFFGVPVQQVQEVIRYQEMTRVPLVPQVVRGLINLRGQIVTAIDLRRRLGMAERPAGQLPMNVVVRTSDGALSLLVDEIGDVIEVEEKTFEKPPETLKGMAREMIRGVHKLPERLLLVLDTERAVDVADPAPVVEDRET